MTKVLSIETLKVVEKALVLLPTKSNKLLLQWKGPYTGVEQFRTNDFKIQEGNKLKSFHANLLKRYIEREEENTGLLEMVSVAVLDSNLSSEEGCEDAPDDLLTTPSAKGSEAPEDIMISDDLTEEQRHGVSAFLNEFPDVFTDRPGLTNLIEHEIRTTT